MRLGGVCPKNFGTTLATDSLTEERKMPTLVKSLLHDSPIMAYHVICRETDGDSS